MATTGYSTTRARVVVVDDHPLFRESLSEAVTRWPELELVGDAADGAGALRLIRELRPDVAVLDLRLPDVSGIEVVEAVRHAGLPTRTVLLSGWHDADAVYATVVAGAAAFLSKERTRREICDAIVAVARGETIMDRTAQADLVRHIQRRHGLAAAQAEAHLSPREGEVLSLIAEGLTTPHIAARLGIGDATVKSHLKGLYDKLGVSDRAAAVAAGWRRQLLR